MPRKSPKPELASRGAYRSGQPECRRCGKDGQPGFVGYPNDTHTPYTDCKGDPTKHQRAPLELGVRS